MKIKTFFKLIIAIIVCQLAGIIGSFFTVSAIPGWYNGITKSALNPPAWVFGPAWITLYFLMGISAFLIWLSYGKEIEEAKKKIIKKALTIFIFQLILNATWSIIFFGLQNPFLALMEIILLWLAILWIIIYFYKISRLAGLLLLPYILWVSFAIYLNYSIWVLN
ncbi:tryptophan-rich sensory protein [Candidatus Wolfebacteria bacterium]|nr:tryptophan-rich sensory protein [Candidatus Wolfebacteria bacterium]